MNLKQEYDVIVVGAGPAGTTTAKGCAERGLNVLVLNKGAEIGAPKKCGEGISENSVQQLKLDIPNNCIRQKILGAYIYAPNKKEIKVHFKGSDGYIIERKMFDKWLASEAAKAGAQIITKAHVYDITKDEKGFINGVKARIINEEVIIKSKIVVAADGVESLILRKAGIRSNKKPNLVDSCFQYELCNINIRDPNMIEMFLGRNIAPRGYVWIFPKGKDVANVGIGINGMGCEKTAKEYLDSFIKNHENLKYGSILETNAGCVPVGGLMENMVGNGILGVGDSVNQVNSLHGGGIAESIFAGRIAADIIKQSIDADDISSKFLDRYNKTWWKERGNRLKKVEKIRETFENMTDDNMNDLSEVLLGEDLTGFVRGKSMPKLAKILLKYKMKGLARKIGI